MKNLWNKIFGIKQEVPNTEIKQQNVLTDDEKHSYRYFLQYKFIPDLVAGVSKGELSPEAILQTDNWESFMKKHVDEDFFFEWDELRCNGIKVNDNYVMAVYIFPKPRQVPEAACGAVLINTTNNDATYGLYLILYRTHVIYEKERVKVTQRYQFFCIFYHL